jgi:hypothetical protein
MTQEEFIEILKEKDYSYEIEGDNIVVTHKWTVHLNSLTSLPSGVEFNNAGIVYLNSLTSLPSGVEFRNGGDVNLNSIIGGWFQDWKGNIEGIGSKRLLNLMISKGVFER